VIIITLSKSQHGFDFTFSHLHQLICCVHAMAIFATLILLTRPEHLLLPYLKNNATVWLADNRAHHQFAKDVLGHHTLTLVLVIEDFFALLILGYL